MPNPVELQRYLGGVEYPCRKGDLVSAAIRNGADQSLIDAINELPDDEYSGPHVVQDAMF